MPKPNYTPADFALPKVVGLAIHNAKSLRSKAVATVEDRPWLSGLYPETKPYALYGVHSDGNAEILSGVDHAKTLENLMTERNLTALSDSHGFIGFAWSRPTAKRKGGEPEWDAKAAPKGSKAWKGGAK